MTLMQEISENYASAYPSGVKYLKLTKCWSALPIPRRLLASMKDRLETIHFDRVLSDLLMLSYAEQYPLLDLRHIILERVLPLDFVFFISRCGPLESIKFVNTMGYITLTECSIRRLIIQDCNPFSLLDSLITIPLESFSFRGPNLDIPNLLESSYNSLETLELETGTPILRINDILKMTKLKKVKIHCNWYHEVELRNHFESLEGMQSYEIICCAPTPGKNLLETLNEECLLEIMSNLSEGKWDWYPTSEWHSLTLADPRFIYLVPWLSIDEKFLKAYPLHDVEFYKDIGARVTQLSVNDISSESFNQLIPHFTNLKGLKMFRILSYAPMSKEERAELTSDDDEDDGRVWFTSENADHIDVDAIPAVKQLYMREVPIINTKWISFFRRINPVLKHFEILIMYTETMADCLQELHNLEYFKDHQEWSNYEFLGQNKKLSHLEVPEITDCWAISNTDSLRKFVCIYSEEKLNEEQALELNRFTNLEYLSLIVDKESRNLFLNALNLPNLRCVKLRFRDDVDDSLILMWIRHFRDVKRLEVQYMFYFERITNVLIGQPEGELEFAMKRIGRFTWLLTH